MIKALIKQDLLPLEKFTFSSFSKENSAMFIGSPIQHPYEDDKFILICDPLTDNTKFIEFRRTDLLFAEETSSIVTDAGKQISISKIWVKLGATAVKYEPFVVTKVQDVFNLKL